MVDGALIFLFLMYLLLSTYKMGCSKVHRRDSFSITDFAGHCVTALVQVKNIVKSAEPTQ